MSVGLRPGTVLRYPYLWHWQDARGETEGRKERPTAVAVVFLAREGQEYVLLLPLTTREPAAARVAVEIPDTEKRRAGLDRTLRQWLILDEYNLDPLQASYYLRGDTVTGQFSEAFIRPVLTRFRSLLPQARRVSRYP
ncbi:hypothetical protein AAC691_04820 [Nguyenibacter vanlangensis]|uniref:PemK-like, MazF-like toxin of type II toxin-antitoxin system n=1 Tax=Nguyenibacter vanlangensis TaxID=1216886 RepID=A0ABZ3D8H5_9PROT